MLELIGEAKCQGPNIPNEKAPVDQVMNLDFGGHVQMTYIANLSQGHFGEAVAAKPQP